MISQQKININIPSGTLQFETQVLKTISAQNVQHFSDLPTVHRLLLQCKSAGLNSPCLPSLFCFSQSPQSVCVSTYVPFKAATIWTYSCPKQESARQTHQPASTRKTEANEPQLLTLALILSRLFLASGPICTAPQDPFRDIRDDHLTGRYKLSTFCTVQHSLLPARVYIFQYIPLKPEENKCGDR